MTSILNIEEITIKNRKKGPIIISTDKKGKGGRIQIAVMSLKNGEDIPFETHAHVTQFIRVEKGEGLAFIGRKKFVISEGDSFTIPSKIRHRILCTGKTLKMYSIYAKDSTDEKWVH